MNALPGYHNVFALPCVANHTADPAQQRRELAEAAPFWTDMDDMPIEAPAWQFRDGNGRIIRKADVLPMIKPQREIDAELRKAAADKGGPGIIVWLLAFSGSTLAALIMAGFDWLVGAM